jgi:hypothetical protein
MTHLCPRGKPQGDLDKVTPSVDEHHANFQFFSTMQDSEAESHEHVKRKQEEMTEDDHHDETKIRCPCPICGAMVLEEEINAHLDGCLNRSAVLKLVREEDKRDVNAGPPIKFKAAPSQPRKRRR